MGYFDLLFDFICTKIELQIDTYQDLADLCMKALSARNYIDFMLAKIIAVAKEKIVSIVPLVLNKLSRMSEFVIYFKHLEQYVFLEPDLLLPIYIDALIDK